MEFNNITPTYTIILIHMCKYISAIEFSIKRIKTSIYGRSADGFGECKYTDLYTYVHTLRV